MCHRYRSLSNHACTVPFTLIYETYYTGHAYAIRFTYMSYTSLIITNSDFIPLGKSVYGPNKS